MKLKKGDEAQLADNTKESDVREESSFDNSLDQLLPELDRRLGSIGIPTRERIWKATNFIVKRMMVSIEGEEKSDFLNSLGFGFVFRSVEAWYEKVYGDLTEAFLQNELTGLVMIRQELYRLTFPRLTQLEDDAEGHMRLKFSNCLEEQEDPVDFIVDAPPFGTMDLSDQKSLADSIALTMGQVRQIWLKVIALDGPREKIHELSSPLICEICRTSRYVAPFSTHDLGRFLESLRLSCELVLKLALLQHTGDFKKIHNFDKLCNELSMEDRTAFKTGAPKEIWYYKEISDSRYGKQVMLSVNDAFDLYRRVLGFVLVFVSRLNRRIKVDGAVVTLRKPVWAEAVYQIESEDRV